MSKAASLHVGCVAFGLLFAVAAGAQDAANPAALQTEPTPAPQAQLPSWMSPDVVGAAVAIGMDDAQVHTFNEAVGQFVTDHFSMIQREVRREAPDLEQRIHSRDGALVRQMDARVEPILRKDQLPAYENYKKALRTALESSPLPQTSTGMRSQHGVGGGRG